MTTAAWLTGNAADVLYQLPAASHDLAITSPPFLRLRAYTDGDDLELGQEGTPAEFLQRLLEVTAQLGRVITSTGSIAVELGDTYSGSGGAGGDYTSPEGQRTGQPAFTGSAAGARASNPDAWPRRKSLVGIPQLYQLALTYGHNPLTGQPSPAGRWVVRNLRPWIRPNPPVGALGDKVRPATSYWVIATQSDQRWHDLEAVRSPAMTGAPPLDWQHHLTTVIAHHMRQQAAQGQQATADSITRALIAAGISDDGDAIYATPSTYRGSHYATFPEHLIDPLIAELAPSKVCRQCDHPSARIIDRQRTFSQPSASAGRSTAGKQGGQMGSTWEVSRRTIGWSCCGCCGQPTSPDQLATTDHCTTDHWRPGRVLDPFAGSGTTLAVASARGLDSTGIDLDPANLELARERVGLWLTTPDLASYAAAITQQKGTAA